MIPEDLLLIHP